MNNNVKIYFNNNNFKFQIQDFWFETLRLSLSLNHALLGFVLPFKVGAQKQVYCLIKNNQTCQPIKDQSKRMGREKNMMRVIYLLISSLSKRLQSHYYL